MVPCKTGTAKARTVRTIGPSKLGPPEPGPSNPYVNVRTGAVQTGTVTRRDGQDRAVNFELHLRRGNVVDFRLRCRSGL